ncbi:MAG TPA: beta-N-acetylglucosaminidase domain-containing protein [Verrucomicrobiae bacterium]
MPKQEFLAGVIEGFYGPPWSQQERFELFDWMAAWKLNTYVYAPKDDLKHRALWRQTYSAPEARALAKVASACKRAGIRFVYALSPGLDIRYSNEEDLDRLRDRFAQMIGLGCHDFALLFDDIPDRLHPQDRKRWGTFAAAQCHVANTLFHWTRERCPQARFLFCPTPYCGRMAARDLGGRDYLAVLGRELSPEIDVFWTGPEIISHKITVAHVRELQAILHRKPVIWDNLHANDYDGRRFYCGPYSGRPLELRQEVNGLLANPNNEFPLNYMPLRTLARFVHSPSRPRWNARQAYRSAMAEWRSRFATVGRPVTLRDLILFGDCYYLPHEEGPEAEALYQGLRRLVTTNPANWGRQARAIRRQVARLRSFCGVTTELCHRPLFHALSRRIWELREELDLLGGYLELNSLKRRPGTACRSDFHLPGTYRGGLVARLQRLLIQQRDGTFARARNVED